MFLRSFCGFLMVHWDFQYKNEQNEAIECTNVQFAANLTKNPRNYAKTSIFLGYKTLVLLKKPVKIDVSTYESVQ